jgi:hypothetical protein
MKYTEETVNIILESIAKGLKQKDAAILAGISEDTLSRWKSENADFAGKVRQKEIENKKRYIEIILEASKTSWQAAAWWLERNYPDEFSLKAEYRVKVDQGRSISDVLDELESENDVARMAKLEFEKSLTQ